MTASFLCKYIGVAQPGERLPYKQDVVGSNPITDTIYTGVVQLVEHTSDKGVVVGSIPAASTTLYAGII